MRRTLIGFGVLVLFLPARAAGQPVKAERYDLGQRLRALERAWDAQPDAAARRQALPVIKRAVPLFFAGRGAAAADTLDQSRLILRRVDDPAVRWAEALIVRPSARLLDPAAGPFTVTLSACYDSQAEPPAGATVRLSLRAADGTALPAAAEVTVARLPVSAELPADKLPEGDHTLRVEVVAGGKTLATYEEMVSVAPRLRERVDTLQTAAQGSGEPSTDRATLHALAELLDKLTQRYLYETDYPAARLLAEAEALARAVAVPEQFYGPRRTGEYWLTLATTKGAAPVRLFVPESVKAGKPVPLVVALHGAGGSENLFFDAYGNGAVVRLARERGWVVVATRASSLFGGPPPAPAVIDELVRLYPIDRGRVYVVGHSMGASHAVQLAQQVPGRFAAIAPLGGGGGVTKPEAVRELPIFIGCGAEDFALPGARGLAESLRKVGATRVIVKEYTDVEHIMIVQEALKDVFTFFEANGKKD
jgi:predicted esterase